MKAAGASILLILGLLAQASAVEWEIRRFDGRDHVPAQQVAEFYGLSPGSAAHTYQEGRRSLAFQKNVREMQINGLRYWLAFPTPERDGRLWVARLDLSETIEPALRPERAPGISRPGLVVLDAGHGGSDKGTSGARQFEKNFTLDLARRVRDALKASGLRVIMTRNADVSLELPQRSAIANSKSSSGAIFVSLHFNSASNLAAQGFEIFCVTPRGAPSTDYDQLLERDMIREKGNASELPSFVLATSIYHAMHGQFDMADRGVKRARFAVLRETKIPAVLIEGGFLSNASDARQVASPEWRTRLARSIADGILAYARLGATGRPPPLAAEYRSHPPREALADLRLADSSQTKTKTARKPDEAAINLRQLPER